MRCSRWMPVMLPVVLVAGCGGGSQERPAASRVPECAHAGSSITRPSELPASFPLPVGTVLTASRETPAQGGSFTVIEGFVPGELEAAKEFLTKRLPAAGFPLGEGDSEEHEAESDFSGRGLSGRFKLHDIDGCAGALTLTLAVRPS